MFAKIFNQIYDSSIVESPETRFTFMDLLILADRNGVVDMTLEAIARRTNRPIELIQKTITELEGPDPHSRTPDANGARIFRLDDHRNWGWGIINYDYYRKLASQEQRREKTKLRTQKWRKKQQESSPKRHAASHGVTGDDLPSPSPYSYLSVLKEGVRGRFLEWIPVRKAQGKKPKDWDAMFSEQVRWLQQFSEADQIEILSASIRNNWQGLHLPEKQKRNAPQTTTTIPTWGDRKALKEMIGEVQEQKNELFKMKQREQRAFTPDEQAKYDDLAKRLEGLKSA